MSYICNDVNLLCLCSFVQSGLGTNEICTIHADDARGLTHQGGRVTYTFLGWGENVYHFSVLMCPTRVTPFVQTSFVRNFFPFVV